MNKEHTCAYSCETNSISLIPTWKYFVDFLRHLLLLLVLCLTYLEFIIFLVILAFICFHVKSCIFVLLIVWTTMASILVVLVYFNIFGSYWYINFRFFFLFHSIRFDPFWIHFVLVVRSHLLSTIVVPI